MESKLIAVAEEEIKQIKESKLVYSIGKFQKLSSDQKEMLNSRYMKALNLHTGFINDALVDEAEKFLDYEKDKIEYIREQNQPIINMYVEQLIKNLRRNLSEYSDDILRCAKIFEYVSKIMEYDEDISVYDSTIPFGTRYPISAFYKGVPLSSNYSGLLVTRCGSSNDIANLMVYLGNEFGLNIKTLNCTHGDNSYSINTLEYKGKISYMDVTSVIRKRKSIEQACLVNRDTLIKDDKYYGIKQVGTTLNVKLDYGGSGIDKVISRERNSQLTLDEDSIIYVNDFGEKVNEENHKK